MKKAAIVSIQSYYVFLIIARQMGWNIPQEKTVEVRKDYPKASDWNKTTYIYCSKNKKSFNRIPKEYQPLMAKLLGKVIGEFVCDKIYSILDGLNNSVELEKACLTIEEAGNYLGRIDSPMCYTIYGIKKGYAWYISNLKIYDKPKDLCEFCVYKKCTSCKDSGYESGACCFDEDCKIPAPITKPPQSWQYCESLEE